jgi:hypothetical protein
LNPRHRGQRWWVRGCWFRGWWVRGWYRFPSAGRASGVPAGTACGRQRGCHSAVAGQGRGFRLCSCGSGVDPLRDSSANRSPVIPSSCSQQLPTRKPVTKGDRRENRLLRKLMNFTPCESPNL